MKPYLVAALIGLLFIACAFGESAHKGWRATPEGWPKATGGKQGFRPKDRGSLYQPIPIQHFYMQAPFVRVDKPDPPANAAFKAEYWFKMDCTITLQKVYMLVPSQDGTVKTQEIKTTPLSVYSKEVVEGYYAASFSTEEVSFKEGDTFVVVFKINGETTMVFLRILYCPFEPS
jgi:hypothetical protein